MKQFYQHIEIVSSTTIELSSMGQKPREAIQTILRQYYSKVGITIVNNLSDLESLVAKKPDLVFLGMKFIPCNPRLGFADPDRIWLSDYLTERGITCTGSSSFSHQLELDKSLAKQHVLNAGLQTSPFYVAQMHKTLYRHDIQLNYPLFIKPVDRGGGDGVDSKSFARNFSEVQEKVASITSSIGSNSIIEEYLPGREISVAILKDEHSPHYSAMPIERIVPSDKKGLKILSPEIKHADAGLSVAVTDLNVKTKVTTLAIDAFHALRAREYGRIDIRLDKDGTPTFLEANLLPSLIDGYGNYPKAYALNKQRSYETMLLTIVRLGFDRAGKSHATTHVDIGDVLKPLNPILEA